MASYVAPVRDIRFALDVMADLPQLLSLPGFTHVDSATVDELLSEYGRFCEEVFAPLDRSGDIVTSTHDAVTGAVTTAPGFVDAYKQYLDAGWNAVPFDPAHGGGGFPWVINLAMQEMMNSANLGFALGPLLTQGAIDALTHIGTEEQQETYLRKMVSGEWTGTMNLTEPQAGSDVGALTTKAVPAADGTWRIFGQKIFITYGEHDMTNNIIHLVLARTPGAPAGTKGISLFVVPKFLLDDAGNPAAANDVRCVGIEHKLGIKASPTCVMAYGDAGEGAVGYMLGQEFQGMRGMFVMMNNARLSVGVQGLSVAERAYQNAAQYALERVQGRPIGGQVGDSIIGHPDVRRMLLTMRSQIEAVRGLLFLNARTLDVSMHHADASERERARELADVLTPLSKAWGTDLAVEIASLAIQVYGGMGFIEETGVAQQYRDARILPIYEGTNGIQALDLVGRKMGMRGGAAFSDMLQLIEHTASDLASAGLGEMAAGLSSAVAVVGKTAGALAGSQQVEVMSGATAFLRAVSNTVGGWMMGRQALAAQAAVAAGADDGYYAAKLVTAQFYFEQILVTVDGLCQQTLCGSDAIMALRPDQFASR
jgi:3-(methylthio)propanoyl-CoA dehydrogenase